MREGESKREKDARFFRAFNLFPVQCRQKVYGEKLPATMLQVPNSIFQQGTLPHIPTYHEMVPRPRDSGAGLSWKQSRTESYRKFVKHDEETGGTM